MKRLAVNQYGRIRFGVYLILAWAAILLIDPAARLYDTHVRSDPAIFATVRLEPGKNGPRVLYSVLANQTIRLRFATWLQAKDGERYCSGGDIWVYTREKHNGTERAFALSAWLSAAHTCTPPEPPYSACVDFTNLGSVGAAYWGPFCSKPYWGTKK